MVERGGWKPRPKEEKFEAGSPGGGGTPKDAEGQRHLSLGKQQENRLLVPSDPEYERYRDILGDYLQRIQRWQAILSQPKYFISRDESHGVARDYLPQRYGRQGFDITYPLGEHPQIAPVPLRDASNRDPSEETMVRAVLHWRILQNSHQYKHLRDDAQKLEVMVSGSYNKAFIDPYTHTRLKYLSIKADEDQVIMFGYSMKIALSYDRPVDYQWGREYWVKPGENGDQLNIGVRSRDEKPLTEDHVKALFDLTDSLILPAGQTLLEK